MSERQYEEFIRAYKNTIYRSRNEYVRKMLLGKPITVIYRNRSLDDFIEIAIKIKKELRTLAATTAFTQTERAELKYKADLIIANLIKIVEQCSQNQKHIEA